jgi:response regulator RpfG family c-di-GMP phosphodiesterase
VLHDVGKIALPDTVLLKPGRLNPDELALMQEHPVVGR